MQNVDGRLYSIALECARMSDAGCACDCTQCQFNIFNYVEDVREASLLKANAYTDYYRAKQNQAFLDNQNHNREHLLWLIGAIVIGVCISCCNSLKICAHGSPSEIIKTPEVQYLLAHQNQIENLPKVYNEMLKIQRMTDYNKDGLINCIDYSLAFRYLYGRDAIIVVNRNPNNGFNHMFIGIIDRYHNKTIYIEPQGHPKEYTMEHWWGDRYDPKYNHNETAAWDWYLK